MKYLSKITPCICAILLLIGQGGILTSCNDDLAADSYYTFTGEMMSDFWRTVKISASSNAS